jgi:phosphomannomutase/phosphoglucomutase
MDCRHSSPEFQARLVEGLVSTGVNVTFLPMVPTPLFYFAVKTLGHHAGVMITASHNPPEYNGFKVWAGQNTIHTDEIQKLHSIMRDGDYAQGSGIASEFNVIPHYLKEVAGQIKLSNPLRIVVDGGNGSAGQVCSDLLQRIGAEVIPLYCDPDPDFPNHHPDPTVLGNITDLMAEVTKRKAHFGVGLDGDGDRIGVVDEQGRVIYGDRLLAVYARDLLEKHPGSTVLGEVKCSHLLFKDIHDHGGQPLMVKTGHSLIKAGMKETGALLAGEMSGHMFFADRYYGFDDALYAAARLAEIVSRNPSRGLSTYLDDWPATFNTPEIRMDCPDEIKFRVVDLAREYFQNSNDSFELNEVDGVRLNFADGWGLLRASNTQPVLVLRFEAETQARLEEIRTLFEHPLQTWIAELS